jgi:predicted transposase YdaD
VYILMEFQSRPDPSMPVRLMGYVHNFYEDLMARQPASGWRKLPLVIPVVVYNGTEPWHVAEDLGDLPRFGLPEEEAAPDAPTLEEFEAMLAESIDRWNQEIREAGRQEGRLEGRQEGKVEGEAGILLRLLRSKFGALNAVVESRVRSADADQLLEWADRVLTSERLEDVFRS